MVLFPNAKINLGLYVTGKRPDGFHNLESIFYPVPFQDVLEIQTAENFSFHSYGINVTGNAEDNLCVKAYRLLRQHYDIPPVQIHLLKNIPAGAGLGGGSSDASYTLKLLNDLFQLKIDQKELGKLAAQLGSDCPFFISNAACYVTGRGEVLEPIDLKLRGYHITIVHPGIHISTKEAFANLSPKPADVSLKDIVQKPIGEWKRWLRNDFEEYAFKTYPVLAEIRQKLYDDGALFASMSGSGSAVYGISKAELSINYNSYIVWKGRL